MNASGKDKTIEFDIKKEMIPVKFRYLKNGKGGRKHIVAIIANYKKKQTKPQCNTEIWNDKQHGPHKQPKVNSGARE